MWIEVTKEHIKNAVKTDSHHCMIADAIRDKLPNAQYISVDIQTIRFTDPEAKKRYTYLTPRDAQWGIIRFDRGVKNIQPFEFGLRNPTFIKVRRKSGSKKHGKKKQPGSKYVVVRKYREFGLRIYETKQIEATQYPVLRKKQEPVTKKQSSKESQREFHQKAKEYFRK